MCLLFLIMTIGLHLSFLCLVCFAEEGLPPTREALTPAPQPRLLLDLQFRSPDGNAMPAGKKGLLILSVTNESDISAENVVVEIEEEEESGALYFERSIVLGMIGPRMTISKEISVFSAAEAESCEIFLTVRVRDYNEEMSPAKIVRIELKAIDPPQLSVSVAGVRDQDGQKRIESEKVILVTVRVQNNGTGNASRVSAHVRTWRDVFVAGDGNTYFELGDIAAGEFVEFAFLVYTGASVKKGEKIPVTIYLNEARSQFDVVSPLMLPLEIPLNGNTDAGAS